MLSDLFFFPVIALHNMKRLVYSQNDCSMSQTIYAMEITSMSMYIKMDEKYVIHNTI